MKLRKDEKIRLFDSLGDEWPTRFSKGTLKSVLRLLSPTDAAELSNMTVCGVLYHVRHGHLPQPITIGSRKFWVGDVAEAVVAFLNKEIK